MSIFSDSRGGRVASYDTYAGIEARPIRQCRSKPFDNCVVDGDTFWLNGEQIRLANVDAPEVAGHCAAESSLAGEARRTLVRLLDNRHIWIRATGRDSEGRLIARIETPRGDVGEDLLHWDVVAATRGGRATGTDWCGSGR